MRRCSPSISVLCLLALSLVAGPVVAGELRTDTIESRAISQAVKLNVLLPDGYDDHPARRYPVVYLLHGYGGNYAEWQRVGVEVESKGLPVIVAMPEGDQSFWVDHHGKKDARWEAYIVGEVIPHVDSRYRTLARRESRAVSGLSMGGYGAVILGLRHPELFASVASHSGAVGILARDLGGGIGKRIAEIFGPTGSDERKKYDPLQVLDALDEGKRPHLYIDCGSRDFLLESNRTFVRELAKRGVDYEYREVPGKHDFAYWKRNVRYSLTRQLEALETAAAAAKKSEPEGVPADPYAAILGTWALKVVLNDNPLDYEMRFKKSAGKLEAVYVSPRSGEYPATPVEFEPKGQGGKLTVRVPRTYGGENVTFRFEGKLSGGKLTGKLIPEGFEDQVDGAIEFSGERKKDAGSTTEI